MTTAVDWDVKHQFDQTNKQACFPDDEQYYWGSLFTLIKNFICLLVLKILFLFFFFFDSVLRPFQDYFSSYETGQSAGGTKTGEPREKNPGTPASRSWLVSHMASEGLEPTPDTAVR